MYEKCICGYFYRDGYSEKKGKVVTLFGDEEFIFVENLMIPSPPNSEGSGLIRVDFYRCPKCKTLKVDAHSLDRLHYLISLQKEMTDKSPTRFKVKITKENVAKSWEYIGENEDCKVYLVNLYKKGVEVYIWDDKFDPKSMERVRK